jgi:hypothetical protein
MESIQSKKFGGLEKNPTYLELINYIETNNDKIKMPDRRAKFLRNSFYLSQLDGEGMRRQEEQEQLKDREADKDLMIKKFAEDFGLQLQGIKQYLQRLGLEPVRRSEFRSPEARSTPYKGVIRTADKRRRRETKFHSPQSAPKRTPQSFNIASEDEQEQQDKEEMAQIAEEPVRDLEGAFEAEDVARDAAEAGVPSTRLMRAAELGKQAAGMAGSALQATGSVAVGLGSVALGVAGSAASTNRLYHQNIWATYCFCCRTKFGWQHC